MAARVKIKMKICSAVFRWTGLRRPFHTSSVIAVDLPKVPNIVLPDFAKNLYAEAQKQEVQNLQQLKPKERNEQIDNDDEDIAKKQKLNSNQSDSSCNIVTINDEDEAESAIFSSLDEDNNANHDGDWHDDLEKTFSSKRDADVISHTNFRDSGHDHSPDQRQSLSILDALRAHGKVQHDSKFGPNPRKKRKLKSQYTNDVLPVNPGDNPRILTSKDDLPEAPLGPLSDLPKPNLDNMVKLFGLRNMTRAASPYNLSLRKFMLADYKIADMTMLTRALLNRGAMNVVAVTNSSERQTNKIQVFMDSYNNILGSNKVTLYAGDIQKLDLPDGCPPAHYLLENAQYADWNQRAHVALTGHIHYPSGSLFLFTHLFKTALRTGIFRWGRCPMFLILPRYATEQLFSQTTRLGILMQVVCDVREHVVFSRNLFVPSAKCEAGPGEMTVHFVEITPKVSPDAEPNIFFMLDFLLRRMQLRARSVNRALRALGQDYVPLVEMAKLDGDMSLQDLRIPDFVRLATTLCKWKDKPLSAQSVPGLQSIDTSAANDVASNKISSPMAAKRKNP